MKCNRLCPNVYIILTVFLIAFSSCGMRKNVVYFKDIPDSVFLASKNIPTTQFTDPKIKPNDIVQVTILTLDVAVNAMLNAEGTASFSTQPATSSGQAGGPVTGLMVDKDGNIELPVIGKIKIGGLTTAEARDSIHDKVEVHYKNPVVNVKLSNMAITIIGEVTRPATYYIPNEKVSVLDAIGLAGDLTLFGKRENILLIRDSAGVKQFARFNLTSSSIVNSPYFYLQQGDLVYVEPNTARIRSIDAARRNTYSLLISAAAILISVLFRL